ncbi:MAG: hypothetical protein SGARI_006448, partial [Bacillariaceae sp.]
MHRIVDSYRQRYRVANRADKTVLVRAVIQEIRDGGARFLRRSPDRGTEWEGVRDEAVYEKISHALRGSGSGRSNPSETPVCSPSRPAKAGVPKPKSQRKRDLHPSPGTASNVSAVASFSLAGIDAHGGGGGGMQQMGSHHFSALANNSISGSNAGESNLLASLLMQQRLASNLGGAPAAAMPSSALENLVTSHLLQNQLAQQLEQERQLQLLTSSSTDTPSNQLLDLLRASGAGSRAQQPLFNTNSQQLLQGGSAANL